MYPPGFAPYQRVSVETYITSAAEDAAQGKKWARKSHWADPNHWGECQYESTQRRWVAKALSLLGLGPVSQQEEAVVSQVLSVALLWLNMVREQILQTCSLRIWGEQVIHVYGKMPFNQKTRQRRLLILGTQAGLWGEVFYWERGRLHTDERFQWGGMRDPPRLE